MSRQILATVLAGVIVVGSTASAYAAISGGAEPARSGGDETATSPGFAGRQGGPQTVTPQPGAENVRPIAWQQAEVLDSQTVRVLYTSGVEPCYVLDHVNVDYRPDEVVITLYQGNAPGAAHTACIQIAEQKATVVTLSEPLAGRTIVDGSQRR